MFGNFLSLDIQKSHLLTKYHVTVGALSGGYRLKIKSHHTVFLPKITDLILIKPRNLTTNLQKICGTGGYFNIWAYKQQDLDDGKLHGK